MVDFFRSAGFGGLSYVVFESGRRGEVSLLLRDGVPDQVHQGFIELGLGRHDVNFRHALATGRPSLRSQTVRNIALSPKELEHHQGREALNYGDSLTLPLYGPFNHVAVISLGLPSAPSDFDEHRWTTLHMAAQGAHLRCLQLYKELGAQPHNLSVREVEVLDWVARGKSNAVIADILASQVRPSILISGAYSISWMWLTEPRRR